MHGSTRGKSLSLRLRYSFPTHARAGILGARFVPILEFLSIRRFARRYPDSVYARSIQTFQRNRSFGFSVTGTIKQRGVPFTGDSTAAALNDWIAGAGPLDGASDFLLATSYQRRKFTVDG